MASPSLEAASSGKALALPEASPFGTDRFAIALDPLTKQMLHLAVSAAAGCAHCVASHTAAARAKGMTDQEFMELVAIVGKASETNRMVTALAVPIDEVFLKPA